MTDGPIWSIEMGYREDSFPTLDCNKLVVLWNLVKWETDNSTGDLNAILHDHLGTARKMEITIVPESLF